jgi:hypothetical protein
VLLNLVKEDVPCRVIVRGAEPLPRDIITRRARNKLLWDIEMNDFTPADNLHNRLAG